MRFEGRLDKWSDDRGYGFIAPTRGGEPVFVHISAFPRDGRRPQLGDPLTFEVEPAGDGKKRAIRVERPGSQARERTWRVGVEATRHGSRSRRGKSAFAGAVVAVALAVFGGNALYKQLTGSRGGAAAVATEPGPLPAMLQPSTSAFRCDGRTHCSQMTSCAEATFFLKNCPGTQMDGDGDGIPCEQQWCN